MYGLITVQPHAILRLSSQTLRHRFVYTLDTVLIVENRDHVRHASECSFPPFLFPYYFFFSFLASGNVIRIDACDIKLRNKLNGLFKNTLLNNYLAMTSCFGSLIPATQCRVHILWQ